MNRFALCPFSIYVAFADQVLLAPLDTHPIYVPGKGLGITLVRFER
jgi:hypothetical protein